jgi:tRNA A58 N-methylase Trm61
MEEKMKNIKYSLRFVFILTLAFFVSQFIVSAQGQSFDDQVLEKLDIKEGMIVADVGAGNGKFSVKIARIVGLEGHVYANEIDEDRIQKIESLIEEKKIENITIIHGEEEDAVLPVKVDFIVLKFVYHHLSSPDNFINNLLKYLNPGGRLAVIAADINHDNPDRENKEDRDPCISDPEKTKKAIEQSGFQFEKREDVKQSKEVDYILIFKASEVVH